MKLKLDDTSQEPLQRQLTRQIRALILSKELPTGEAMLSIRKLAKREGISIITVQRAYDNLVREGLIFTRRGKGFFVAPIHLTKRKSLAKKRLSEGAEPLIRTANSEGLHGREISGVIDGIIKKVEIK